MEGYVVDASVALKWVLREGDSDRALLLLDQSLYVPDLLLSECGNALWRKVRSGDLSQPLAENQFNHLLSAPVTVLPAIEFAQSALDLAIRLDHPIYDCLYLAIADEMDLPLVTADRAFFKKAVETSAAWLIELQDLTILE